MFKPTAFAVGFFCQMGKLIFIVLLHRSIKCVIPRKGEALTWESPATQHEEIRAN